MAKILAGVISGTDERLRNVLEGHDVHMVRTMAEALAALREWVPDLVVIGMRFDESRMFDLLRHIRSEARHAAIPVVCLRVNAHSLGGMNLEAVRLASQELGADLFVDFQEFPNHPSGHARIRRAIERLLYGPRVSAGQQI